MDTISNIYKSTSGLTITTVFTLDLQEQAFIQIREVHLSEPMPEIGMLITITKAFLELPKEAVVKYGVYLDTVNVLT